MNKSFPVPILWPSLLCAAFLLTAGCATEAPVYDSPLVSSKVLRMDGSARYSSQDDNSKHAQNWQPVHAGDTLPPGALIETGARSWLDLSLGSPPRQASKDSGRKWVQGVRLYESSTVRIDISARKQNETSDDFVEELRLDLRSGRINVHLAAISDASRYEIKFPRGIVRVGEGLYTIEAGGRVIVEKGRAFVTRKDTGETKELTSGQQLDPATGQTTGLQTRRP